MFAKAAGWKTVSINIITLAVLLLTSLTGTVTDAGTLQIIIGALAVLNVILRFLTNGPVGKSPPLVVEEGGKATEVTAAVAEAAAKEGGE